MSLSWPGALRSPKIKAAEGGIKRWGFLQRGMSSGKGSQQPVSLCSSRRELCPWCSGKAGIWDGRRGNPRGWSNPCPLSLPAARTASSPSPAGAGRGTRDPLQGQGSPPSPHPWRQQVPTTPRAPGLAANPGEQSPPGARRGRPHPSGGRSARKGQTPHPGPSGTPARHSGDAARGALPARLSRRSPARAPPSRARTGAGPPGPAIPPSPPHSPRGAATSPCRAGVGTAPAREGGRGREGAAAAPSVPLHVPGAGQPRKRGRGGGGGHGATSDPAAEVVGARARRERARAAREEPLLPAGGRCLRDRGAVTKSHRID